MKKEVNIPPAEFQERLIHLGGCNRYDEANFKLGWGQYETFTAGGIWSVDERYYLGYRQLLAGSGEPCWTLFQFHEAAEYGTPEAYYATNLDDTTGLQMLGEYPYGGRYEVLYNLRWHERVGDKLEFRSIPLTTRTFDEIIPIILAAKGVSLERRKAAYLEAKARQDAIETDEIERHLRDQALPFSNQVSFSRQGIRSSVVDQKMLQLQRSWAQLQKNASQFSRPGLQTR